MNRQWTSKLWPELMRRLYSAASISKQNSLTRRNKALRGVPAKISSRKFLKFMKELRKTKLIISKWIQVS